EPRRTRALSERDSRRGGNVPLDLAVARLFGSNVLEQAADRRVGIRTSDSVPERPTARRGIGARTDRALSSSRWRLEGRNRTEMVAGDRRTGRRTVHFTNATGE